MRLPSYRYVGLDGCSYYSLTRARRRVGKACMNRPSNPTYVPSCLTGPSTGGPLAGCAESQRFDLFEIYMKGTNVAA
jgi:hypothetical protein